MFFRDVVGQRAIKERLIRSVSEERVSHAQIFSGPEGCGNLALALAYAQFISCENKQDHDSCGTCPSCRKYGKLIHPDLHFVFPVVKTPRFKDPVSDNFLEDWRTMVLSDSYFNLNDWFSQIGSDNAQGLIYSHESDEIIRKLNLKSYESDYKVMIVWMPEKMHVSCANKLLKMIEEPPQKTLFLLVTQQEEEIIATIRSRCQLNRVLRIEPDELKTKLSEDHNLSDDGLDRMVHLSHGDYRKALALLGKDEQQGFNFENYKELMRLSYARKFMALFDWVNVMATIGRERQKLFLQYALNQTRENFISNLNNLKLVYLNDQENAFASRFSPFINERNVIPIAEELERAYRDIAMNGSARIILTDLSLRIVKLIRQ